MAWQSRVVDMERSFEDATAFVRVARRRHGGTKDASTSSKQLQEDYDALLAENNDDENDDAGREAGDVERGNGSASSTRPSEDDAVGAVARVVVDESDASEDESDGATSSAVPGFDDFGPAMCAVDDATRKKKRLKPSQTSLTFARRALDAVRNIGLVGAAALFGTFLVFVAFAVYEEMRNDGTDALRPELGPMAYVDSRTVAEEAAIRGESAKEALLDVEREVKRTTD